ncbi:MAG: AAA family ATPase [Candidatus Latescibacteria bacterium]|jgi:flagellar biosynthesis protein FlhG|nr:AAA family ATPase [Candidatus Latescibacterota bacterium]
MPENIQISCADQEILYILPEETNKKVWTFAGGKGGTGKTAITANIGVALATMGYRVILVDADLGGANLHTILNIKRPKVTLSDFINRRINNLGDILLNTPSENLRLISGGSDMVGLANIPYQSKIRLQRHLENLEADYILLDLGAGTNFNTLDFFVLSNKGFVVCNPEPTAKINAYTFLKSVVYRLIEHEFKRGTLIKELIVKEGRNNKRGSLPIPELLKRIHDVDSDSSGKIKKILSKIQPRLIMNKLRRFSQEREGLQLAGLTDKYLGVSLSYLGMVRDDSHVVDSSELMMPFVLQFPGCGASKDIYSLLGKLDVEDKLGRFAVKRSSRLKRYVKTERRYWYH